MRGLNKVQLIGNVGADPDVKYTDQGTARTAFSVAVNRQWNDADGQAQQDTEWVPVLTWGKLAEIAGEYITRGKRVYIEGRLHTHMWTAEDTGEKRYRTEVIAQELILLGSRDAQGDDDADAEPSAPPAQPDTSRPPQRRRRQAPRQSNSNEPDWDAMGL